MELTSLQEWIPLLFYPGLLYCDDLSEGSKLLRIYRYTIRDYDSLQCTFLGLKGVNQPWLALDLPHLSGGCSNEAVLYAVLNISKLSHKIELKFRSLKDYFRPLLVTCRSARTRSSSSWINQTVSTSLRLDIFKEFHRVIGIYKQYLQCSSYAQDQPG